MLFRTRYNVLFRQFRLLTAQAGSIPAAIRLIFENCYKSKNSVNMWNLGARPVILCLKASGTALCDSTKTLRCLVPASRAGRFKNEKQTREKTMKIRRGPKMQYILLFFGQHRTIPALRLKHRSGSCGTASALPKCSIMSGCGTRIVLRGQKPLALCDRCPCFGSLFPPLAALTFAASSIICAFGLASAAPRSPYRHLELCGIALDNYS